MPLLDRLRALSPLRQAALLAGIFILLCVGGAAAYFTFLRTSYTTLFANLRLSEAAAIVSDLDKKKVPYRLKDKGATILVPTKSVDAVRLDETSGDLPLQGQVGFELFNKSDMGLTEFAQRINYQRALQGELARTIMSLDAVDTARVHLSLPDPSVFRDDRRPPKASATIVPRPGRMLSRAAVAGIRRLIAAAVPDLDPAAVVILDDHGDILGEDGASIGTAGLTPLGAAVTPAGPLDQASALDPSSGTGARTHRSATQWLRYLLGGLILSLVFLAGYLARRGAGSPRLSAEDRTTYVEHLRSLLNQEASRARPLV